MSEENKRETPLDLAGIIENAFLMGVGVLDITREKAGEFADELIERGKVSKSEAKVVAEKIGDVAEKQQEVVRSTVARETDRAFKTAGFATKSDLEALRSEIGEIKALIADLAAKGPKPPVSG